MLRCTEVVRIAAENPFLAEQPGLDQRWLHVAYLLEPIVSDVFATVTLPAAEGGRAVLGDGAVYLLLPHGMGRSKLGAGLGRALQTTVTARNWRTVTTLAKMCEES